MLMIQLCIVNSGFAEATNGVSESSTFVSPVLAAPELGDCKTYSSDSLGMHHRICFDSVCVLMRNFIESFNDDAKKNGLGGYIEGSLLKEPPHTEEKYKGWLFYNACYNTSFKKEFFLAYLYDSVASPDLIPCSIQSEIYYHHSSSPFLYPDSPTTLKGISDFLSNMPKPEGPMNSVIRGKDLDSACLNFANHFESSGTPINENYCGMFLGSEIDTILQQPDCIGLRFFFGYEPDRSADKIRIIFIGVDKDGRNILLNNSGKEAIFYENEWPPSKE